ncbi:hypothetical protein AGIG_G4992 [Arapaima gigas]
MRPCQPRLRFSSLDAFRNSVFSRLSSSHNTLVCFEIIGFCHGVGSVLTPTGSDWLGFFCSRSRSNPPAEPFSESLDDVFIYITGLKLTDQGEFTCLFTFFCSTSFLVASTKLLVKGAEVVAAAERVIDKSSATSITAALLCAVLLTGLFSTGVAVMMKKRRTPRAAPPRPALPSVVSVNFDSGSSSLSVELQETTPVSSTSDNVYAVLQFSGTSSCNTFKN